MSEEYVSDQKIKEKITSNFKKIIIYFFFR